MDSTERLSSLIIPVANEIFHEACSGRETVEFYLNEHFMHLIKGQDGRSRSASRPLVSAFAKKGERPEDTTSSVRAPPITPW